MHTKKNAHFFLGANAPTGFYSLYDTLVNLDAKEQIYFIKGGPGCGKSSFMQHIAKGAQAAGFDVEYIHCSADPESLDAIHIPALQIVYADSTAPH